MLKVFFPAAVLALSFSSYSFADDQPSESKSAIKIEDVNPEKNKASGDVDEVITNNLLRAQTGSKSKWSIASSFAYYGGSINEPLAADRPNITAGNANTLNANLVGDISGKYNIDQMHSVLAGVGVRWITPLNGPNAPAGNKKYDADNPYVTYQYIYKAYGLQNVVTLGPTIYTQSNTRAQGYVADFSLGQTSIYAVGHSGLSLGVSVAVAGNTFDNSSPKLAAAQTDYDFAAYPFAEYQLSDKINLRTLVGAIFEHTRAIASATTFEKDKVYESFGVGFSVTRDIFLYPNVQFIPDQLRPTQTNVGVSANINVF